MNTGPGDHWRGPAGGQDQRPFGGFGPNGPSQPPHNVNVLPPPPYQQQQQQQHHSSQPSGSHSLSIADLTQGPPSQHQYNTQPPPAAAPPPPPPSQSQGHPMSTLGQPPIPQHSPQYQIRDRDLMNRREQEIREQEFRERERRNFELDSQRRREEMMLAEREAMQRQEREQRELDRLRQEQAQAQQQPVQSHAGSIPIHQPVANKVQNSIHGPNGLLANGGAGLSQPNGPSTSAPGGIFGASAHEPQRNQFPQQTLAPPQPQQPAQSFMPSPASLQASAQLHQQQPILNDALSYLDQVKIQFSNDPDVYNKFLDIMKDFKSQAIDTPGVIARVSGLFNGHPMLIQGFNTFLPPGYRIECGTEENPDAIRVTTPSGTTTQSLNQAARGQFGHSSLNKVMDRQDKYDDNASAVHQQEQRGVSSLQNAVTAASNGAGRPGRPSSPTNQPAGFSLVPPDLITPRTGPVEFNHAISYVNKIKNRFAQQPEIYKQFLEILQTYQRESKPIQDVYAQVTALFHTAPDLLEDFKQFLPETAANAKTQAAARVAANEEMSNIRGDSDYAAGALRGGDATPKPPRMPPMGQFDPPSTSKDTKKRRAGGGQAAIPTIENSLAQSSRAIPAQVGNANKRQKVAPPRQPQVDAVVTSPTLIPALPEPLPPHPTFPTTQEELGFFDRVRKQIGNRANYTEFLKLINLYTQDLIDKYTLADRAISFFGGNPDLIQWFKDFLSIQDQEEFVESRIKVDPGRVNLAHCRSLGPSYRHLPKRDQNKTCKGRDGMCYAVLNDVWASHPTWASEDSGFVAHRKNQYEEALHRIEEERHDYDFHIESCQRTIQLMEPIVQQIQTMSEVERAQFTLHPNLGGASEAIPKRIVMKIYGREVGGRVLNDMLAKPIGVLPVVLSRLKQKLEEWKAVQREWEKVWRDQINKQFWKSLDHQGINSKNLDKKNFQAKTLTTEIQAKWEEGKKNREAGTETSKHQLEYSFQDSDVVRDAYKLVATLLVSDRSALSENEVPRVREWLLDFISNFFGMDRAALAASTNSIRTEDAEMQDGVDSDTPSGSKAKNGRGSLLKKALDKRNGKDDSASASKESTPAPTTENDMDVDDEAESDREEQPQSPWIKIETGNRDISQQQLSLEEAYPHNTYNLYANANIYCFFRLFEALYSRLLAIKANEASVREAVARFKHNGDRKKPALDMHYIDKGPEYFFESLIATSEHHFYSEILGMCRDVMLGLREQSHLEETLRRYYNKTGWQLYTVDRLVSAILRFLANILGGDPKDKSVDIANLFFKDRERPDTTRKQEIQYRKQVERYSKDGEVYRISYTPDNNACTIRLFPSEDPTFDSDALSDDQLWQYYVASYSMRDATEGVDQSALAKAYLRRNLAVQHENPDLSYKKTFEDIKHFDDQSAFISPTNYKILLSNDFIFWHKGAKEAKGRGGKVLVGPVDLDGVPVGGESVGEGEYGGEWKGERRDAFEEKFVVNNEWMKEKSQEEVARRKAVFEEAYKEKGLMGFEEGLVRGADGGGLQGLMGVGSGMGAAGVVDADETMSTGGGDAAMGGASG